ncbi:MAG TPA: outer membrane beta-barrel family protein [Bacteroidia bacterium]
MNKYKTIFLFLFLCSIVCAQENTITVSGLVKDKANHTPLAYTSILLKTEKNSVFVTGTISGEEGHFSIPGIKTGNYILVISLIGYDSKKQVLFIGNLSSFLDIGTIELEQSSSTIREIEVTAKQDEVSGKMDKKIFSVDDNISQSGGSVLQVMQNLPGITIQDGKVQLRGNEKITILIDGKQTALTGFGSQSGLDNIPASSIEKIEIINNPSSKYDANGNGGIINIILKKNQQEGFNGKIGLATGMGALWIRKENLPGIRPQYQGTPKVNPSLSLNYRKKKINAFIQTDYLYTETLNKNEFVTRNYTNGTIIQQQTKRNRNTHFTNSRIGFDWNINEQNLLTVSGFFGSEKIIDRGDEPFFNADLSERLRLWQFLEDELKTTVMATSAYQHKFKQAGHALNFGFNYTFHRENEKYFFDNILPSYTGHDAFKLLSDEQVFDITTDYIKPLKHGRIETGLKLRKRDIPTNMQFFPGVNSPLDTNAGGRATYEELIPALYGNYILETKKAEAELGMRFEYVDLNYEVNPNHNTYKSDGYAYTQPFPTVRLAYKINDQNKLSLFYNRRVDRPNEVDIRIFPKYDDAEIIKVGNPALKPQFTNSFEIGYKTSWQKGYFYTAAYHRIADATITRISTSIPGSTLIYAIFQNVNRSYNTGIEAVFTQEIAKWYTLNINLNGYRNQINAFTVNNLYPVQHSFSALTQEIYSGTAKCNHSFRFKKNIDAQLTFVYMAPDLVPQGKIAQRFSLDIGVKKKIQKDKGELFLNATDLLNTMIIKREIRGAEFNYISTDYYETQVIRVGYNYKF